MPDLAAPIFHITDRSQWQAAQKTGTYSHPSLETEGFIHCSTADQVVWVANAFFRGQTGLVLLQIAPEQLDDLRFDPVPEVGLFPHLYSELPVSAVAQVFEFEPNSAGEFVLPAAMAAGATEAE
ncbi:MAG: DUF952 domain-containing protein [Elainella sp.]